VGFTSCGLLAKGLSNSVAGIWVCVGSLNVVVNPGCFWLVNKKALVGAFPEEETGCFGLPNEKAPAGRSPDVPDEGAPENKGMFCLELVNDKVLAGVLEGAADVGVTDEKETGCLELASEKALAGRVPEIPDKNVPDADEKVCLVPTNAKAPTGRSLAVLGADGTLSLGAKPGVPVDKGPAFDDIIAFLCPPRGKGSSGFMIL